MKVIEEYLKKDLGRRDLTSWEEIRRAYMERASKLVGIDYQSPSFAHSLTSQAGRRHGRIQANINDYTRDQHDLAYKYEKKFVREYVPTIGMLPISSYVTSSGMAALTTIITMLHREHGTHNIVLVGAHSYFQNWEVLHRSFEHVISFDENDEATWKELIEKEKPLAVFVDSLCNVHSLTTSPVIKMAQLLRKQKGKHYLIVDNSLLGYGFPWKAILRYRSSSFTIVGWESLNKFNQFGLDRTTGGIVWGSNERTSVALFRSRMAAGTILSDIQCAMLPTPSRQVMKIYLRRIHSNGELMASILKENISAQTATITRAQTGYGFNGAQIVVQFAKGKSYFQMQRVIMRIVKQTKSEGIQLVGGSSFGLPHTRVYVTARKTNYAERFFRISVGTEEKEQISAIAQIIANTL